MECYMEQNCRVCMEEGSRSMISVFRQLNSYRISTKLESLAGIKIDPEDCLPKVICRKCVKSLKECLKFIQLCQNSDSIYKRLLSEILEETDSVQVLCSDDDTSEIKGFDNEISITNEEEKPDKNTDDIDETAEFLECEIFMNIKEDNPEKSTNENTIETESLNTEICVTNTNEKSTNKNTMEAESLNTEICATNNKDKKPTKPDVTKRKGRHVKQQCCTCGKILSSRRSLKYHMRRHTRDRPYSCVDCGASFVKMVSLAYHRRKHPGVQPYGCAHCPRTFASKGGLIYHLRLHTGERNFKCSTCGRTFVTKGNLDEHLKSHTGDKRHVCYICGRRFTRSCHLRRHVHLIHNDEDPFCCNVCSATFTSKKDFKKHKLVHDSIESEVS